MCDPLLAAANVTGLILCRASVTLTQNWAWYKVGSPGYSRKSAPNFEPCEMKYLESTILLVTLRMNRRNVNSLEEPSSHKFQSQKLTPCDEYPCTPPMMEGNGHWGPSISV